MTFKIRDRLGVCGFNSEKVWKLTARVIRRKSQDVVSSRFSSAALL
jgi:hypothetical protein